MTILLQCYSL